MQHCSHKDIHQAQHGISLTFHSLFQAFLGSPHLNLISLVALNI